MEMTQEESNNKEERLVVSYGPVLLLLGIVFTLSAWYAFADSLLSVPSGREDWGFLLYGVLGSVIFPLSVVQAITRKTVFTPNKVFDKKFYKLTLERSISDIERLENLDGNRLCFTFSDGARIIIHCRQRNYTKVPAFISKHTDGRVEIASTWAKGKWGNLNY